MSDQPTQKPDETSPQDGHVSARVPEKVSRGVFSTGQVVLDSPKEFMIDFLQTLARPMQVVARVIVTPATMSEVIAALGQNLEMYTQRFGPPPVPPPPPPQEKRPTIEEIYANLKLPEDVMAGQYANAVMISHTPTEFALDFVAGFYPSPAVSSRIFIPAVQIPRFVGMLTTAMQQYQQRMGPPRTGENVQGPNPNDQ